MILTACVFSIQTVYRLCFDDDNNKADFWNDNSDISNDFTNMFKKLHAKYHDFFNIWNANWLASHQITDHVIDLKLNTEFSYMCMYNMFSAELKTLNNYLNNALVKKWICEFQSSADTFILFVFQKSEELCFYIDYYELNVIIIKNCYLLSLISELLDWLNNLIIFSKIYLQNVYHKICICQNDE